MHVPFLHQQEHGPAAFVQEQICPQPARVLAVSFQCHAGHQTQHDHLAFGRGRHGHIQPRILGRLLLLVPFLLLDLSLVNHRVASSVCCPT